MADENMFVTRKNKDLLGQEDYTAEINMTKKQYLDAEKKRKAAADNAANNAQNDVQGEKNKEHSLYQKEYEKRLKLTGELMPNRFSGKDGNSMTAVKKTLNELNLLMAEAINYESKESFRNQLKAAAKKYDELITACKTYIERHSHAWRRSDEGKYRKKLVGQLLELATMERASLTDSANAEQLFKLQIPEAVLGNAVGGRLTVPEDIYTDDLTKDGEILKKEAKEGDRDITYEISEKSNTITDQAANTAGTYRIFDYLGLGALTENAGMVCIKEKNPGKEQPHSLIGVVKQGAYHTGGDTPDRTMEELESTYQNCQLRYSREAGKCLSQIKVMTLLLGGNIDAKKDIRFVYTTKKLDGKDFIYITGAYMSANAKLFDKNILGNDYANAETGLDKSTLPKMDRDLKERLSAMTKEDAKFLLGDIMDEVKINAFLSRLHYIKELESANSPSYMRCDKAFPELVGENAKIDGYYKETKAGEEERKFEDKCKKLKERIGSSPTMIAEKLADVASAIRLPGYDDLKKNARNDLSVEALDTVVKKVIDEKVIQRIIEKYAEHTRELIDSFNSKLNNQEGPIPESFKRQNEDADEEGLRKRYAAYRVAREHPLHLHNYKRDKNLFEYLKTIELPKGLSFESKTIEKLLSDGIKEFCREVKITADSRDQNIEWADDILRLLSEVKTEPDTEEADGLEAYNDKYESDNLYILYDSYTGARDMQKVYDDRMQKRRNNKKEREKKKVKAEIEKLKDQKTKAYADYDRLLEFKNKLDGILPAVAEFKKQKGLKKLTPDFIKGIKDKFIELGADSLNADLTEDEEKKLTKAMDDENVYEEGVAEDFFPLVKLLYRLQDHVKKLEKDVKDEFFALENEYERIDRDFGNPGNVLYNEFGNELFVKKNDLYDAEVTRTVQKKKWDYADEAKGIVRERQDAIKKKLDTYKLTASADYKKAKKDILNKYYDFFEELKKGTQKLADEKSLKKKLKALEKTLNKVKEKIRSGGFLSGDEKDESFMEEKQEFLASDEFQQFLDESLKEDIEEFDKKVKYYKLRMKHERFVDDGREAKYKAGLHTTDGINFAKENCTLPIFTEMLKITLDHDKTTKKKFKDTIDSLSFVKERLKKSDANAVTELRLEDISKEDYEKLKESNSFLANRLFTDYRVRHCDELKIKRITPTEVTLPLVNGAITAMEDEKEGEFTNAVLRPLVKLSENPKERSHYAGVEKGKKIKIYPSSKRLRLFGKDVRHQGETNSLDMHGVCGPASAALVINQVYGMEITDENNNVDLLARMKNFAMTEYDELDRDGNQIIDPVTKTAKKSGVYSGGSTGLENMDALYKAFNLECQGYYSDEPEASLNEVTKKLKQGYQVQMSVSAKLLWRDDSSDLLINDPDVLEDVKVSQREDWKKGIAHSTHFINVCGLYYEEGVDEKGDVPSGFIIRDTGQGVTKAVSFDQLKRAYIGDGSVFKEVQDTKVLFIKASNMTQEQLDKQKEHEKKAKEERQNNPLGSLSEVVGEIQKTAKPERDFMDKTIETLEKAIKTNDEKLYDMEKTDREWAFLSEDRRILEKEFDSWYEYNMDISDKFVNDPSYKELVEKEKKIRRANSPRFYHMQKLEQNLPSRAKHYIDSRPNTDVFKKWSKNTGETAKHLLNSVAEHKDDFTAIRRILDENIGTWVTLEKFTKEDFESLKKQSPYAAGRIINEYILRNNKKLPALEIGKDKNTIDTISGEINLTDKKTDDHFYEVEFQKKYEYSEKVEKKKNKYLIYPDPRTFAETQYGLQNLDGFRDTSAVTVCTRMINTLAKKHVAFLNNSVEFLKNQGRVEIQKAYETDAKTGDFVLEDGKKVELPYPDYEHSGAINEESMKMLFSSYNFSCNLYPADSMKIDAIESMVMEGKAVAVSVPNALLEKKKDRIGGIPDTAFEADTYINICGVYKPDGAAAIEGFIIQKPDDDLVTMVKKEELSEMLYGSDQKTVTGSKILVGESRMDGFDEDKKKEEKHE